MSEKEQWMEYLQIRFEQNLQAMPVAFTDSKKFTEAMLETIADAISAIKPIGRNFGGGQR